MFRRRICTRILLTWTGLPESPEFLLIPLIMDCQESVLLRLVASAIRRRGASSIRRTRYPRRSHGIKENITGVSAAITGGSCRVFARQETEREVLSSRDMRPR